MHPCLETDQAQCVQSTRDKETNASQRNKETLKKCTMWYIVIKVWVDSSDQRRRKELSRR